ncbi:NAD-dependent glycerol-3-phosphate dehydrogenase [Cantharellus anzutake]|uniref:NAD-dependent glycerol-3-phosphate dehydrogenase n=1 Tax=Cantharellus anzutake TaxID=1750568 RepID=UPI001902D387|nr:NAD-dependent glycerol-3-phosphate dehydrogenase [Cantharellus anzutake]KAF8338064.1 NAD-dependent glycerol-3-phosphate dehydrogenase [Cantharellus anzutake]
MAAPLPSRSRVLVLGSGNFGCCLADHLADSEHDVVLWSRNAEAVKSLNETHKHPHYLKGHTFPESIKAIGPQLPDSETLSSADVILFAIPTPGLRAILKEINNRWDPSSLPLIIFVNKGIEVGTKALTLEIIADTCGAEVAKVATFLSGPSFATEIINRQPTNVSVVSLSLQHAQRAAAVFHQPWFRCYAGNDPIGVQLAGALKNVYALAVGAASGLGYENNTRAGLITRSLAEMTRIGAAYGASPLTFLTLAGVGDLFLTCSSPTSRNYTVGYRLGKGEALKDILNTLGSVAEGVSTAEAVYEIVQDFGVHAPIATAVYEVLYRGVPLADMAQNLMSQPLANQEMDLPGRAGGPVEKLMNKLGLSLANATAA